MSFSVSIVPNDHMGSGNVAPPMREVHLQVSEILEADYISSVQSLSNARPRCLKISKHSAVLSFFFTALATIVSFAQGHYKTDYLSFIAGCCGVLAMVSTKLTYFANSQGLYHEGALRNLLTSGYQFLQKFVVNPNSIPLHPRPNLPDLDNIIQPAAITITPPQSNPGSRVRAISHLQQDLPEQAQIPVQVPVQVQVPLQVPGQAQPPTQVVLQVIPQLSQNPPSADLQLPAETVPAVETVPPAPVADQGVRSTVIRRDSLTTSANAPRSS